MHKKSIIALFFIFLLSISPLNSDSISLNTEISSVSFGPDKLGFGFAPTGTDFVYYKDFNISKNLKHPAYFSTRLIFAMNDNAYFGEYNYETGRPIWIDKYSDIKDKSKYISGYYLNPVALNKTDFALRFGENPISKSGALATLKFSFYSRYEMIREALSVQKGLSSPVFINLNSNTLKAPFDQSHIQAYPWLQDTRQILANDFTTTLSFNFTKPTGFMVMDGVSISTAITLSPSWLGNNITMNSPTANYWRFDIRSSQYLTLYSKKQTNGRNWLSLMLNNTIIFNHIDGSVVPKHRLPTDRLTSTFQNTTSLILYGPQIVASDCYTDIQLSYSTICNFGKIVNEFPSTTYASEWQSILSMNFHMRLFGFMHLSYYAEYRFMTGIHATFPAYAQGAKISFWIAL